MDNLPRLTEEELDLCRKAFQMFDKDGSGTIDVRELKTALNALGQNPTDEELFVMISQVDEDGSKEIEFPEFVKAIQINKAMSEKSAVEQDTIDAFVALGGNSDKSGKISIARLRHIAEEFELTLNVEKLVGEEGKLDMDYEEFKLILT
eukprot:CAMPEP_0202919866 /NCGR_PEP_ID=MMETSP1392-20130828/76554_1 /ASSEMBLY_ACC=CAM_ASM_000868 /TAXON_ID=225041 /ORGANISM="Chlamydomonas chlamydogama, Strain SAG 11-48b" /LENGTH=148 /DNA_ID=CAMNT_0049613327 /DNA_START=173 /DNA_END=619 /DNA_ORIENTATION=+